MESEYFAISARKSSCCSLSSRTSLCQIWPISSGWTCLTRYQAGEPSDPSGFCKTCSSLIDDVLLERTSPFDEGEVSERKGSSQPDPYFSNLLPQEIQFLEQKVFKAEEEAKIYEFEPCSEAYKVRLSKAKQNFMEAKIAYQQDQFAKASAKQNELRLDYTRSRWGDSKTVKAFLFHMSSVCLHPDSLNSLSFCINGYTGNASFGINSKNPETGNDELTWYENVYVNIFKYFHEDVPFHAFFSFRGKYIAMEITWLGAIPVFVNLTDGPEANFQKSTRRQAQLDFCLPISLKAMARFQILKAKHDSLCRATARLTHALDSNDYGKYVYYPTLSRYAAHIQLATNNGHYTAPENDEPIPSTSKEHKICSQNNDDSLPTSIEHGISSDTDIVFLDETNRQDIDYHDIEEVPTWLFNDTLPHQTGEDFPSPTPLPLDQPTTLSDHQGINQARSKRKDKGKGKGKGIGKGKSNRSQEQEQEEEQEQKQKQTENPIHPRKQTVQTREWSPLSFEDEDQMILAQIHDDKHEEPFQEKQAKFLKMVQSSPEPIQLPQLVVRFGSFSDFANEWAKTATMPTCQQTYYRRHLTKYFKPLLLTDTSLDSSLFRFCSFNLYDF